MATTCSRVTRRPGPSRWAASSCLTRATFPRLQGGDRRRAALFIFGAFHDSTGMEQMERLSKWSTSSAASRTRHGAPHCCMIGHLISRGM